MSLTSHQNIATLVGLAPTHTLTPLTHHREDRQGTRYVTQWLDERDAEHRLVARYRTWHNRGLKPPYRQQLGWERYALDGALLDREVRYSKRDSTDYVH